MIFWVTYTVENTVFARALVRTENYNWYEPDFFGDKATRFEDRLGSMPPEGQACNHDRGSSISIEAMISETDVYRLLSHAKPESAALTIRSIK